MTQEVLNFIVPTSTVKMMTQENHHSYISFDKKGFKCVEIHYKQTEFRMLIILPDERFGLKNVIKKPDVQTIESLKDANNSSTERIILKMPKFYIEYEANLNET